MNVNWNSESGKLIEKTLLGLALAAASANSCLNDEELQIIYYDDNKGNIKSRPAQSEDFETDPKIILEQYKQGIEECYKKSKDPDILDKHAQLYQDAYKSRDLLRGGYSDLKDDELSTSLMDKPTVIALELLGKGTLEAAFELDLVGFNKFCEDVSIFKQSVSRNNIELLKRKINPSNTIVYRNLEEEVKKDKRKINKLLSRENSLKRKELLEQIEELKSDKDNETKIKDLKKQIQYLYKTDENSEQILGIMKSISEKQGKMKSLLAEKVQLSPQEIINKIWTIAVISQSLTYKTNDLMDLNEQNMELYYNIAKKYTKRPDATELDDEDIDALKGFLLINERKLNKDMKELIELIKPSTPENEEVWEQNIDKKLYERAGFYYKKNVADILNFADCKYLNELIVSDDDFWQILHVLINSLFSGYFPSNFSIEQRLDYLEHNYKTRLLYNDLDINYDSWAHYNPESYIEDTVTINAKDVKNKAVKNMVHELTNTTLMKYIPVKERGKLYGALAKAGINVDFKNKKVLLNNIEIKYDDLNKIMSTIKYVLNNNTFWSMECEDEKIDNARDTLYNHFMMQRKQEISSSSRLKESETFNIKVRKVNMSDIKYSLCLGNHSHCCTALGSQSNEYTAPLYILNRAISAIEVLADGEPVGNTMVYLAKINGDLAFVIDDIELQTKFQNNDKIKEMIIKYAEQMCKEIGKPDISIYAGPGMQKVDMTDYEYIEDAEMVIVGCSPAGGGVYLDYDAEQHDLGNIEKTDLYKIR